MNSHTRRLLTAALIAFLVLTALFLLLEKTGLVIAAYCFGLLAVIELAGSMFLIANGTKSKYLTNAAFPLVSFQYLTGNLLLSVVIVGLSLSQCWTMPTGWFIFLHILLIAVFCWRFLAMDSGSEEIARVEQNVKSRTVGWKMLRAGAEELLSRTPAEYRKDVASVRDAFQYADPMSDPALEHLDDSIADQLRLLDEAVSGGKAEQVQQTAADLLRKIKDRNARIKLLK